MESGKCVEIYQSPGMIIREVKDYYVIKILVPPKTRLSFFSRENELEFSAERNIEGILEDPCLGLMCMAKAGARIHKSFPLERNVDLDRIRVDYHNHTLTELIPKNK